MRVLCFRGLTELFDFGMRRVLISFNKEHSLRESVIKVVETDSSYERKLIVLVN